MRPRRAVADQLVQQCEQNLAFLIVEALDHLGFTRDESFEDSFIDSSPRLRDMHDLTTPIRDVGLARYQFLFQQLLHRRRNACLGATGHVADLLRIHAPALMKAKKHDPLRSCHAVRVFHFAYQRADVEVREIIDPVRNGNRIAMQDRRKYQLACVGFGTPDSVWNFGLNSVY